MKVHQLIKLLEQQPQNSEVIVFADGHLWPVYEVNKCDNDSVGHDSVEIACGWEYIGAAEDY